MNDNPLISVITPVYNGAEYLPDLIESVLEQDYPHYEHIVIDDGSVDEGATVAVLEKYAGRDSRIRWWTRENKGQYATQNEALKAANGDCIVIIAADDAFITPNAFSQVVNYWKEHSECKFVYGKTRHMEQDGHMLPNIAFWWAPSRWLIRHIVYAQHCSTFVSRQHLMDKQLFFNSNFKYAGDWDWLIRLFDSTDEVGCTRQPLSIVRMHANQASRTADPTAKADEHRLICQTYGGSYRLHVVLTNFLIFRGMTLMALQVLRQNGIKAFCMRIITWITKRRIHSGASAHK